MEVRGPLRTGMASSKDRGGRNKVSREARVKETFSQGLELKGMVGEDSLEKGCNKTVGQSSRIGEMVVAVKLPASQIWRSSAFDV